MRFPPWVGMFSASVVNQSSDCPESANGIGDRITQRQGIYQDIYRGLKMAVLTGCPSVRFSDLGFRPPAPRPFYRPTWDNYIPTSSLR